MQTKQVYELCKALTLVTFFIIGSTAQQASAVGSAYDVMKAVDDRNTGSSRRQSGELVLIDENRDERVRKISQLAKEYNDHEKVITQVDSPRDVKGITILSFDWNETQKDTETWLYLPKLQKVKRLAATDQSSYWLGSDFTYGDLTGLNIDDFSYEFSQEKSDDGLIIIDAVPVAERRRNVVDETGYLSIKYWVDTEKAIVMKAKYELEEGGLFKYYSASEIYEKDGVYVVGKAQMILARGNSYVHASVFQIELVTYNAELEEELFTTYAMERDL